MTPSRKLPSASQSMLDRWAQATQTLVHALPSSQVFPLVDMWRLAMLDPTVGSWCASLTAQSNSNQAADPITVLLRRGTAAITSTSTTDNPRNLILTLLRLLSNTFSCPPLARRVLSTSTRTELSALLVPALLHEDNAVRTAAASLAFNTAAYLQKGRVDRVRNGVAEVEEAEEDGDWEVEMASAIVEAIDREKGSEEVGQCLASLRLFECISH